MTYTLKRIGFISAVKIAADRLSRRPPSCPSSCSSLLNAIFNLILEVDIPLDVLGPILAQIALVGGCGRRHLHRVDRLDL